MKNVINDASIKQINDVKVKTRNTNCSGSIGISGSVALLAVDKIIMALLQSKLETKDGTWVTKRTYQLFKMWELNELKMKNKKWRMTGSLGQKMLFEQWR